ncbi:ABC-type nitrate/sulfonate/bicarbonate transport system, substrate-binding protein [Gracilibacillus ureilyticus]|uniref:ABC-type nitrate/sulfonate/bicarbonate transport system, substrate-binding protein n=1 Tax=Gracilibacillus ureilyticus TaxID=531814 RepID=A0A1H9P710_9BACI|nr:ABC transporter substrate-binding protein [Gracilibacillus ureilyticus]SER43685.1 ABC-type nitrate/sulfonate/bicarbonate transport system, substrate-binding protein [Gracilibacillus ureilyticus]
MKKLLFVISMILLLSACGGEDTNNEKTEENASEELKDITFVLDWTPNTNHTGLYVAKEKGYFEEEGLNVEIILPGEAGADQTVASGQADFGISAQEAVTEARVQDIPIVSIAAVIQHNTSGFAAPVDKGISSPADFAGKTYGGWGAPVEAAVIDSLMKQEGASVEDVEIINMGNSDFFTAVERDVDFAWIYYGWTGVEAELRDVELEMLYLTDYSEKLDYYTPVITTNEEMIDSEPDTVHALLAAVTKGYQFAIDNPSEAADILIEAVPDLDPELVKASQEWLSPKYKDDAARWGEQQADVWKNYADWMFENNLLEEELDVESTFTNEFLPEEN